MKWNKKDEFIRKARKRHGDNIDFSKVEYIDSQTKVCLICHKKDKNGNEHGEYWQTPVQCVRGNSCPKCANERRSLKNKLTIEEFTRREREIFGERYDLSKVVYVDCDTKVCIGCPEHGDFWMRPSSHLRGHGCPKCVGRNFTKEDIVNRFKRENPKGGYYDYSKVDFKDYETEVCIICPIHGEFWQKPSKHLRGHGCPKCGIESSVDIRKCTFKEFEKRASEVHKGKYTYVAHDLKSMHDKVEVICPKHGAFFQNAYDHLNGHGCPKCGFNSSVAEDELVAYIHDELGIENIVQRTKKIIPPQEIDIYLPDYKLGIEYNGVIWHSEKFGKDENYHLDKLNKCNAAGINLIQIFEDEYVNKKDIVLRTLSLLLGKGDNGKEKIYGRDCFPTFIEEEEAKEFLEKNHIESFIKSTVYLGAFSEYGLSAVMSLSEYKPGIWIIDRFAVDIEEWCSGMAKYLFKIFVKWVKPNIVISLVDRRWYGNSKSSFHEKLGFKLIGCSQPDYRIVTSKSTRVIDKIDEKVKGFKIWDCGRLEYVWQNNKRK